MDPELTSWLIQRLLVGLADNASMILISLFSVSVFGLGPIGRGLGRRLSGSAEQETSRLQAQVDQLNERLDFSERLLHQLRPEHDALPEDTTGITTPPATTPV